MGKLLRLTVLSVVCSAIPSFAAILNLEFLATGSGQIGATVFTSQNFRITGEFDTATVLTLVDNYYRVTLANAKVEIGPGLIDADITGTLHAIVGPDEVGLLKSGASLYFLGGDFPIGGYALGAAIVPSLAIPFGGPGEFLTTSAGNFSFTSLSGEATFQVTDSAVPEPATAPLLLAGVGALAVAAHQLRQPTKTRTPREP